MHLRWCRDSGQERLASHAQADPPVDLVFVNSWIVGLDEGVGVGLGLEQAGYQCAAFTPTPRTACATTSRPYSSLAGTTPSAPAPPSTRARQSRCSTNFSPRT